LHRKVAEGNLGNCNPFLGKGGDIPFTLSQGKVLSDELTQEISAKPDPRPLNDYSHTIIVTGAFSKPI